MSASRALATALRVLRQLWREPGTVVLVLFVPSLLITLLRYVFNGQEETFNRVAGRLVELFPFMPMLFVTSIAMLR